MAVGRLAATSDVKFMQLAPNDLIKNLKKALNNTYITTQWLKRTVVFTTLTARKRQCTDKGEEDFYRLRLISKQT